MVSPLVDFSKETEIYRAIIFIYGYWSEDYPQVNNIAMLVLRP